jgi:serine/threonine protein kinase
VGARCPSCRSWFRGGFRCCPRDGALLIQDGFDPLIGARFADRYEIEGLIGEGSFARVYEARHALLSRRFAVKVLRGDASIDPKHRLRFLREADTAARLRHEHLVGVVDVGETDDGLLYIVMDLVPGVDLASLIETDAPFSSARTLRIFCQLATALAHAHDRGLVHRDLKPANVIVEIVDGAREHARIVDFGLALPDPGAGNDRLTTVGMMVGTPAYVSPEQALGMAIDHRADLYALGACLYEALAGAMPFDGTPVEVVQRHISEVPPRIAARGVDPLLEALAFWLMEKAPHARPPDARAVLDTLTLIEKDPASARARLARWMVDDLRTEWRSFDDASTTPMDVPELPCRTSAPSAPVRPTHAKQFSATNRAWPPTIDPRMSDRRAGKLAEGSVPPDAWGRIGTVVNERYELSQVIGVGPHGTVYEAADRSASRRVAIKVLNPTALRLDAPVSDTQREVELAKLFGHPNLVEVERLGRLDDGSLYLVSELVTGIDLAKIIAEGPVSERRALRYAAHVLRGLEAAHRMAVAHGDVKPENLIVAGIGVVDDDLEQVDEAVRVLDISLAPMFRRGAATTVAGIGAHVAPEVRGSGLTSPRGDVYSVGIVLADLLGLDRANLDVAKVSPDTGFVLWRSTQREARDRYRDATEMLAGVERALRGLGCGERSDERRAARP